MTADQATTVTARLGAAGGALVDRGQLGPGPGADRLAPAARRLGVGVPVVAAAWDGRGLPGWADEVAGRELSARRARSASPLGTGMGLAAPTHPGPRLRRRARAGSCAPILTGEHTWCQLFSEPGSGSDLAGLTTRADLDGDEWVVNGQKVWNTSAHHADFGMLLARTDWDVPKHRGITYFVLPMHQPGVEVRPLRQMNCHASFNEVFLTDARVPGDHVVGSVGEGLAGGADHAGPRAPLRRRCARRPAQPCGRAGPSTRPQAEADEYFAHLRVVPAAGRPRRPASSSGPRRQGVTATRSIRQEIARLLQHCSGLSQLDGRARRGGAGARPAARARRARSASSARATSPAQAAKAHALIAGADGHAHGRGRGRSTGSSPRS